MFVLQNLNIHFIDVIMLSKCILFLAVQERLNKVADCEQLKHCGDLMEQLKFLVEEPRGQRFVVNINVPSQVSCIIA